MIVIAALVVSACATTRSVAPEETFTLRVDESARVDVCDFTIRVIDVRNDSRCPVDATCVWAGDAAIELEITARGRSERIVRSLADDAASGACAIRIAGLSPQPRQGHAIDRDDYRVALIVSGP